jgi:hypothetical protein
MITGLVSSLRNLPAHATILDVSGNAFVARRRPRNERGQIAFPHRTAA